jgi:hypothetical protein
MTISNNWGIGRNFHGMNTGTVRKEINLKLLSAGKGKKAPLSFWLFYA